MPIARRGRSVSVTHRTHDPSSVPAAVGSYTHGLEVPAGARLLFISGQVPVRPDGTVPADFEGQCHAVWENLLAVLASARMRPEHLVKVTTYLTSRDQAEINGRVRRERLGEVRPALTVVIAQTFAAEWLLEIEAIAAA
jgi:2-iminobutanoate/2-iminopropanoate deaminase